MAMTEAQKRANAKYKNKTYEPLTAFVKKGVKQRYKDAAESLNLSLSMLIQNAVEKYIAENQVEK